MRKGILFSKMCISPNYTIPADVPSYIRNSIPNHYIFTEISDPMNQDTDGDGIPDKDDGAKLTEGLAGGIIGELTMISAQSKGGKPDAGHAFLVYKSYIDDTLDFSQLYRGFSLGDWMLIREPGEYIINHNEKVCLGGAGDEQDYDAGSSGSGNGSGSGAAFNGGLYFNREVYNAFKKNGAYKDNAYISRDITQNQLNSAFDALNNFGDYDLFTNNCSEIASKTWKAAFKQEIKSKDLDLANTPRQLKKSILKIEGSKEDYDLLEEFSYINNAA